MTFKEFIEAQFVDDQPTGTWNGPLYGAQQQDTQTFNYPDMATYKQFKVQSDPRTANWTDMQWMIQYHFDRTHAQRQAKTTKPTGNQTPTGGQ